MRSSTIMTSVESRSHRLRFICSYLIHGGFYCAHCVFCCINGTISSCSLFQVPCISVCSFVLSTTSLASRLHCTLNPGLATILEQCVRQSEQVMNKENAKKSMNLYNSPLLLFHFLCLLNRRCMTWLFMLFSAGCSYGKAATMNPKYKSSSFPPSILFPSIEL